MDKNTAYHLSSKLSVVDARIEDCREILAEHDWNALNAHQQAELNICNDLLKNAREHFEALINDISQPPA